VVGANTMKNTDLGEFNFTKETTVSVAERPNKEEVLAVCLESDDHELLIPMKIYKIGLRGNKARVTDEAGETAIYPLDCFLILPLTEETLSVIEKYQTKTLELNETVLA
jgi:hypothetical protein